ncbi:MAG TPA: vitamin K epoxide reductase family protein [Mycobacteriales bacterium]|jgi:uncharacterized membrane protein|nr:vitamin K epoxide reductase family protein [Mycobacteriales bacterium]
MPDSLNVRWAWPISFPLSLIGLGISIYLTYTHYHPGALICKASGHVDCAKVTTSSQSEIFGHIPVALAGLAFYAAMVILMSPWAWQVGNPWLGRLRLASVVAGIGMVCYLVFAETVQIKAICLWCTGVHVVTFLLFLTVLAAYLLRPLDPITN